MTIRKKKIYFRTTAAVILIAIGSVGIVPPHAPSAQAAATNLIANPSVETATVPTKPDSWATGRWGTNTAVFRYPVIGFDGSRAVQVELTQRTTGDAKWWFKEVTVQPGHIYRFSDVYKATIPSTVTIQYRTAAGPFRYVNLGTLPASSTFRTATFDFTVPMDVTALSVFHLIKAVGTLTTDAFSLSEMPITSGIISLNFDDGWKTTYQNALPALNAAGLKSTWYIISGRFNFPAYVTAEQTLNIQAQGHEVGAHTRTHPDLTTLSPSQVQDEVVGSRDDLRNIGIRNVDTFAYPFGSFNDSVVNIVKNAGFRSARTADGGYNTAGTDHWRLVRQAVEGTTTVAEVRSWIDTAIQNNLWLVLVFHHVDDAGESNAITPANFQQIVNYLVQRNANVLTMGQALNVL